MFYQKVSLLTKLKVSFCLKKLGVWRYDQASSMHFDDLIPSSDLPVLRSLGIVSSVSSIISYYIRTYHQKEIRYKIFETSTLGLEQLVRGRWESELMPALLENWKIPSSDLPVLRSLGIVSSVSYHLILY